MSVLPSSAVVTRQHLMVGGCRLGTLAERFGTPLYIVDPLTIAEQVDAYKDALPNSKIHYAAKAWLNTAVAHLMKQLGLKLDVVSIGEAQIAVRAGFLPSELHLHGNGTPRHELEQAVEMGVGRIVVDNLDQLEMLAEITQHKQTKQTIWLRVAPDIVAGGNEKIQTGAKKSKFGLIETEKAVGFALNAPFLRLTGLHCHIGSQITETAVYETAIERLLLIAKKAQPQRWHMREMCIGGGIASYSIDDQPAVLIKEFGEVVRSTLKKQCDALELNPPVLHIEPGRSLVNRAVVAIYQVTGSKLHYLHVDGGMGDNVRPTLYNAEYTAINLSKLEKDLTETYTISGRYCESGDILIKEVKLPKTDVGDLLMTPAAGAYTMSMAGNYNGVPRPAVVLVHDGHAHLIQRRETVSDLVGRDLPLPNLGIKQN